MKVYTSGIISVDVKQYWPKHWLLKYWSPVGLCTTDHNLLSLAVQPIFSPPHYPYFQTILHQFINVSVTGVSVKRPVKGKTNNIHCCPLIHHTSLLITEGYQVGQVWFPLHKSLLITRSKRSVRRYAGFTLVDLHMYKKIARIKKKKKKRET